MAYVSALEDEDLEGGGPLVPGGAPTATAPTPGSAAAPAKKTPGRFADLGEYLRVNAPQKFGEQLAGKVGSDIETAQGKLSGAGDEFRSRADASKVEDTGGLTSQVGTNPEGIDVGAFAKLRDAKYSGPTQFQDAADLYGQTRGAADSAAGKAQASKSEGGRFALLDNYYNKPSYSQGQKTLDNLLVQNDPNSTQAFTQMQENAKQLQSNVAQTGKELGAYGTQAKAATEGTRKSARDALGIDNTGNTTGAGAIGGVMDSLSDRQKQYQAEAQRLSDIGVSGHYRDINPEFNTMLSELGQTYGVNPGQYYNAYDPGSVTQANVASPEELTRLRALDKLAGLQDPFQTEGVESIYNQPLYNFDQPKFQSQVTERKQGFDNSKAPLEKSKDEALSQMQSIRDQYGNGNANEPNTGVNSDAYKVWLNKYNQAVDSLKTLYGQYGINYVGDTARGGGITGGGIR